MKKFIVTDCDNLQSIDITSFDTIEEAKDYIEKQLEFYEPVDPRDSDLESGSHHHWFEIYDGETRTNDDRWGDCLFTSDMVYHENR